MKICFVLSNKYSIPTEKYINEILKFNSEKSDADEISVIHSGIYKIAQVRCAAGITVELSLREAFFSRQKGKLYVGFRESEAPRFDYISQICKKLCEIHPDKIVLFDFADAGASIFKKTKIKPSLLIHEPFIECRFPLAEKYFTCFDKIMFSAKSLLDGAVKNGVPESKAVILRDFAGQVSFSQNEREKIRLKYGLSGKTVGVYCGAFSSAEATDILVKAFVKSERKDIALLLSGKAEDEEFQKALELEANGKIIFANENADSCISAADYLIEPCVSDRASGMTVLEGLSCGLPVIVSDCGAAEYTPESDFAIVIKRGLGYTNTVSQAVDKMTELLPSLTDDEKKQLCDFAGKFSAEKQIPEILDSFRQ